MFSSSPDPSPTNLESLAGQVVGAYRILSPIGHGGMGSVWLAERADGRFERRAAVKFLSVALVGYGEERFKREGAILGRLSHPNIAELLDAGLSVTGQAYLVLEYVDGEPINDYSDRHKLDVPARIRLFLQVLAAVAHAHANLIVHRDIKPSNVLVSHDGHVKLLDFGIAKLIEEGAPGDATATLLTREGGAGLTLEYAAPEQVTGAAVTTSTDVYSLGVLLYVLLSGQHPAGAGIHSPVELLKSIVDVEPRRLSDLTVTAAAGRGTTPDKLRRLFHGDLDTIVAKALKKNPQERYASVGAFEDDLNRYLQNQPISARPDTLGYRTIKFLRRNQTAVALATLALLAIIAGSIGTLIQARTARIQRDFALRELSRADAVNDLNTFILSDAPAGEQFTVSALLDRALQIVERQKNLTAANKAELLLSIGGQYGSQDNSAKAKAVLEEAYQLAQNQPDPSTHAKAACALGNACANVGDMSRAVTLVQQGLAGLPDKPEFILDQVFCRQRAADIARTHGDANEAVAQTQTVISLLQKAPYRSQFMEAVASIDLASSYRIAGRHREAAAEFEKASQQLDALGRDNTEAAVTLDNNWGLSLYQLGEARQSETILRKALEISRANGGDDHVSPLLLVNYARPLRDLGRLEEAAGYAERGYNKAKQSGSQNVVNQALLLRASIYRMQSDLARSQAMLDEAEPWLRAHLPPGHIAMAALLSEKSQLAQARLDLATALALANQALDITEALIRAGKDGQSYLPTFLTRRASIEFQLGQLGPATADDKRAIALLQKDAPPGAFSLYIGNAELLLGRALQAQGKQDEARAAFRSATENFQHALGPDHSDTLTAQKLSQ